MRNKRVIFIAQAAIIAALYIVLTYVASALNLSSGTIQVRFSEALCVLPVLTPAAIPGLWLGCLLSNFLTGCVLPDIICGSVATLIGAVGTYALKKRKFLCTLPPVLANMVIVPFVLIYAYGVPKVMLKGFDATYWFNFLTVGIGEIISVCILGSILLKALYPHRQRLFGIK